jgi:HptB-dependent secretion and biofilm anti anti-sigma factor
MESQASASPGAGSLTFVIELQGEFDLSDCDRLRDAFSTVASANLIVIDLQKTTYVDSSALKCLFDLRRDTQRRGARLVLVGLTPLVKRILEICRFDQLFDIGDSFRDVCGSHPLEASDVRTLTLVSRTAPTEP